MNRNKRATCRIDFAKKANRRRSANFALRNLISLTKAWDRLVKKVDARNKVLKNESTNN